MRGKLFENRWLLWFFVFAVVPAFVANELGWVTIPDRPGIGLEMNEEAVRKMQRPGSSWFASV